MARLETRSLGPLEQADGADRIVEIASILAAGLMRLRARKSSGFSPETGESSLHFSPPESGHEPDALGPEAGS
jgi:hypothetical protein